MVYMCRWGGWRRRSDIGFKNNSKVDVGTCNVLSAVAGRAREGLWSNFYEDRVVQVDVGLLFCRSSALRARGRDGEIASRFVDRRL